MMKRMSLLLSSTVLVLTALPLTAANAAPPAGVAATLGAEYGYVTCDGCDGESIFGLDGAAAFGFGPAFGGQIAGGYQDFVGGNLWTVDGAVFWAPAGGRLGANVGFTGVSTDVDVDLDITNYGAFGEFYVSDAFTLGAKGGALDISASAFGISGSGTGYYIGGGVMGYVNPNFAIAGTIDYFDLDGSDATNFSALLEYMFSGMTPVSVYGGYTYTDVGDGLSQFRIGLKLYVGSGGMTLVDHHRNGTLGWIGGAGLRQAL